MEGTVVEARERAREREAERAQHESAALRIEADLAWDQARGLRERLDAITADLHTAVEQLGHADRQLRGIHSSRAWRTLETLRRIAGRGR